HRDLKPANLLLDEDDRVHVADFGIARALDEAQKRLTWTGTILGTAGYLSPEQARGEVATPSSDRYTLAVVAHELLHGVRPDGRAVGRVFDRALSADPERRLPTAAAASVRTTTAPTAHRTSPGASARVSRSAARICTNSSPLSARPGHAVSGSRSTTTADAGSDTISAARSRATSSRAPAPRRGRD